MRKIITHLTTMTIYLVMGSIGIMGDKGSTNLTGPEPFNF